MKRLLLLSLLVSFSQLFSQTTFYWRSEATDANWNTSGNWWNGSASGWGFGTQSWNNNHELTQNNNVSGANTHSLVFDAACTSDRTMNGNSLRLYDFGGTDPKITNNSSANITFNIALEGDGDAGDPLKFQIISTGNLVFAGNIDNQGSWIDVEGSGGGNVTISGIISGGGGLYKTGSTVLNLSGNNTYTDNTIVNAGTLNVNSGGTLGSGSDVTVETGAILNINESITIASLTTVGTGAVNIAEGVSLTVTGNLVNAGTITLKAENSSNGSYAQLKVNGSISGTGSVILKQYLENGWHNISSLGDTTAVILGNIGTNSTNGSPNVQNLFTWDATNSAWSNVANNSVSITAGQGFLAFVGDNGSFSDVGILDDAGIASWSYIANTMEDGNFQPTLSYGTAGTGITYNSGNPNDGWNMIGNPFPCALNLTDALGWGDQVEQSVTIYDPSGNYSSTSALTPGGVAIAPGQSFWMRTTASSGNYTFPSINMQNNCDVGQSPTYQKTNNIIADRLFLTAYEATDHSVSDDFLLGMVPGTSDDLDPAWDATKRLNDSNVPSLMSVAGGYPLAINAIDYSPNSIRTKKLQLRFVSGKQNEVYFIELHDSLLSNNYHIELEDLKLRRKHNLNNGAYKFVHDQAAEYRFVLHISPVTTINQGHTHTPVVSGGVNVGVNGGVLVLKMDAPAQDVSGALLDLNGRRVMEVEYPAGVDQHLLDVSSLAKGIYLLQLQSASGEEVHKIILP